MAPVDDVWVIEEREAAASALEEIRARMLAELAEPRSATALAGRLGLARQRANYHLRELERHGLVRFVAERRKRNMNERLYEAAGRTFVISPRALPEIAPDPEAATDRLSASWLAALGARLVGEVGDLLARARSSGRTVATLGLDAEVRFRSASDRAAFAAELTDTLDALIARYHVGDSGGRVHRLVVALYPRPTEAATHEEGE
jgi:DNA-binding transcriptional ArsR family regulator